MNNDTHNTCPRCGASFACGMQNGEHPCWCAEFPVLETTPETGGQCYCPACLRQLIEIQRLQSSS